MIKFGTGVKIKSGIKIGHSASVEENPLVIWLTSNPKLIHIQYNGAGSPKITYTEASGPTLNQIAIVIPTYNSTEYIAPVKPAETDVYHCVMATAWDDFE